MRMRECAMVVLPWILCGIAHAQEPDRITWRQVVHEQDPLFYKSTEAIRVAGNFLLFQAEIGGWDKIDSRRMSRHMVSVLTEEQKERLRSKRDHQCTLITRRPTPK